MESEIKPHVQESINSVMQLYAVYVDGDLDFEALTYKELMDLEIDFKIADKYLNYRRYRDLSTLRQSLISRLLEFK